MKVSEIDETLVFKIFTPGGTILAMKAEDMPNGWQIWDIPLSNIAATASLRLGLKVTVERKQICTASAS